MPPAAVAPPPPRVPLRPIDQAAAMGLSEGEWLTRHAEARVRRIGVPARQLLPRLPALGTVMSLTRNASCVHEKDGVWDRIEISGAMGLVLNHDIDLRLFLNHWVHGYAVETPLETGTRHSLQFFDRAGVAVHKIFARPTTDMAAWAALVEETAEDGPPPPLAAAPLPPPAADRPDDRIAIDAVRKRWAELKDVHDFFALLRQEQVGRLQAMRLAGAPYSRPVPVAAIQPLLEQAAADGVPIMCFVGNRGCIQIHSGPIHRVVAMGPWLNILDRGFNLHLRIDQVAHAFAVWKPQRDSAVHSVELFAADGTLIAQFFGERKPGVPEIAAWRDLVRGLPEA
ncbi:MAG: ChuX/HutX family heme-like substrate-binding protein [Sphingomonadaceae bacterium]